MRKFAAVSVLLATLLAQWPRDVWAARVRVPVGTAVLCKIVSEVTPAANGAGDVVMMSVVQDVVADGKVVVKAGSVAQAEVTGIQKRSFFGVPAKIVIHARRVNAVDGTVLTIGNSKTAEGESHMACSIIGTIFCLFPALIQGGNTKIASGSMLDTVTTAPADVEVP